MKFVRDWGVVTWSFVTAALALVLVVAVVLGLTVSTAVSPPPAKASDAVPLVQDAYSLGGSGMAAGFNVSAINAWGGATYNLLNQAALVRTEEGAAPTDSLLLAVSSAAQYAQQAASAQTASQATSARTATLNAVYQALQAVSGKYVPVPGPVPNPLGAQPSPSAPQAPLPAPVPTPSMPAIPPLPGPKG